MYMPVWSQGNIGNNLCGYLTTEALVCNHRDMGRENPNMQRIAMFLDPEMHAGLKELSAVTLAPVGALIRAAIADYLEKRKDELPTPKKAGKK
jgi:hypothetical protein